MTGFEDWGQPLAAEAAAEGLDMPPVGTGPARHCDPLPLQRARETLARMVVAALAQPADDTPVRLAVPVPGLDPLAWLAAQPAGPSLFWREREGGWRVAGLGAADRLVPAASDAVPALLAQAARRLRHAPDQTRYFGGFRFDGAARRDPAWRDFGLGWLVMPRFEAVAQGSQAQLVCTVIPGRDRVDDVLAALGQLSDTPRAPSAPPAVRRVADHPDAWGWAEAVAAVTEGIAGGEAWRKVVLARRTDLHAAAPVEPLGLLARFAATAPGCFHFLFNPTGNCAFLGASPEQLFHRRGPMLASEALAGTRPRGADATSDAAFEAALRGSAKDGREHGFVDAHVRAALAELTEAAAGDASVSVLKLATVQHLVRRMQGRLRPGFGDAEAMAALHPTPAVCGDPPELAVARIRALEPFDRGWYAGPVGHVGRTESRFAVGIRSALVSGCAVAAFTGAGVVEGSRPGAEWQELEAKLGAIWPGAAG